MPAPAVPVQVIVVEDHKPFIDALRRAFHHLDVAHPGRAHLAAVVDPEEAIGRHDWQGVDAVIVDAYRHETPWTVPPSSSRFTGLDIADAIHRSAPGTRVVGCSAWAGTPEVNITFRQVAGVVAVYEKAALVEHLDEALWSDDHPHQVPAPTDADHDRLGVAPGAQVWAAILAMRKVQARDRHPHGDAWERVAVTEPGRQIADRTREYIKDRVAPLLGITGHGNHRAVVAVIQRVVKLPTAPSR